MSFYFVKRHFFNMKIDILVWSVSASVVPSIAEFQMGGIGLSSTFLSFYFYLFFHFFVSLDLFFVVSKLLFGVQCCCCCANSKES